MSLSNRYLKIVALFLLVIGLAAAVKYDRTSLEATVGEFDADAAKIARLEAELKLIKDKEEADERLGQYALNMMNRTLKGRSLSDGKKLVLARAIVRVSNDIFEKTEHAHGFITALSIESEFQRFVQSPTGPKGYAQVARASFHEAMQQCGVKVNDNEDVWETDLNLYAGACYFRMMLELPDVDKDPFVAIVAYNQGPNAEAIKTFAKSGRLDSVEALKYVAKFTYLKRRNTDKVEKGTPALKDLPTPTFKGKSEAKVQPTQPAVAETK